MWPPQLQRGQKCFLILGGEGEGAATAALRVRDATQLLCMGSEGPPAQRRLKHAAFAELAGEPDGSEAVLLTLRRLWHTPVLGRTKEPYWRLVYDGIPTAARMHMGHQTCPCGAAPADRAHHFWPCLVAGAVRSTVLRAAASAGRPLQSLRRGHLWLARPPQGINQGVWDVVALAAVAAMEKGRACMVAEHRYASHSGKPCPSGAGRLSSTHRILGTAPRVCRHGRLAQGGPARPTRGRDAPILVPCLSWSRHCTGPPAGGRGSHHISRTRVLT